jgi:RNA polymerase sigma-70 factor (ECF subfamily)
MTARPREGAPTEGPSQPSDDADEWVLLTAARRGDEKAFGALLDRHRPGLQRFCFLMLGDTERGGQTLQDATLTAWRERDGASDCPSVRIWLHRIAIRACLEALEAPAMSSRPGERLTDRA